MTDNKKGKIIQIAIGILFMVPWALYQLQPLLFLIVIDGWEIAFTLLMIGGLIILASVKKEARVRVPRRKPLKLPRT